MNYSEKLKSPKWQKKRLEVLNRDNFTCCKCGDTETELQVHHLKYTREPHESHLSDLETLCKDCHGYISRNNKTLFDDLDIPIEEIESVTKFKQCMVIGYKSFIVLAWIDDGCLMSVFKKKTKVIDLLYKLSNQL